MIEPGANTSVLYISYNGMLDPLGQTQVIPYLRALAELGFEFTLLSFERAAAYTPDGVRRCDNLKRELANSRIDWRWLRYHQRPSLPATSFDVMAGIRYASRLAMRKQVELVHARSHIPATIALRLKRKLGVKMIFDVRGLLADEYVDAGHWRKDSLPYRITKSAERRALAATDGVVTLTERIWPIIRRWDPLRDRNVPHEVVPCCADLEFFKFSGEDRARRRHELGLQGRLIVVYSGSIDGWYLTDSMADFFVALRQHQPRAHFLWLTPTRHDRINSLMKSRGVNENDYTVIAAASRDVPSYLSASDVGLAFIKPCFSKLASSPTKYGEYLGCGLPLVINAGIGDSDTLITRETVGVLIEDFSAGEYLRAVACIDGFVESTDAIRLRSRKVAERLFDLRRVGVQRYARLYQTVLAG